MPKPNVLDMELVAEKAKCGKDNVKRWRRERADFPEPQVLSIGPVWDPDDIDEFLRQPRTPGRRKKEATT